MTDRLDEINGTFSTIRLHAVPITEKVEYIAPWNNRETCCFDIWWKITSWSKTSETPWTHRDFEVLITWCTILSADDLVSPLYAGPSFVNVWPLALARLSPGSHNEWDHGLFCSYHELVKLLSLQINPTIQYSNNSLRNKQFSAVKHCAKQLRKWTVIGTVTRWHRVQMGLLTPTHRNTGGAVIVWKCYQTRQWVKAL